MLVVETIAKIRRAYFVHGQPIKAICRDLGVSRKVVRKVIRSEATEFRYEREAQPLPKIGPWSDKLDQLLLANEGKASRERLTLIRLGDPSRSMPIPTASSSARTGRSSPSIPARSVAAIRSMTPGITSRCSPASPAPCATVRPSRTGSCRPRWSVCGVS